MHYRTLKLNQYSHDSYSVVPIRKEDMRLIREWRNEQMTILRQAEPISEESQKKYYQNMIIPLFEMEHPPQLLFSFFCGHELIGYGGLTHMDWSSQHAEVSFLLNTQRVRDHDLYQKEFSIFLTLIKKIAFEDIRFHRLFTETYNIRPLHIETLLKNGFVLEGCLREHVKIEGHFVDSLIHGYLRDAYHEVE